jgi:hypothetical protein
MAYRIFLCSLTVAEEPAPRLDMFVGDSPVSTLTGTKTDRIFAHLTDLAFLVKY